MALQRGYLSKSEQGSGLFYCPHGLDSPSLDTIGAGPRRTKIVGTLGPYCWWAEDLDPVLEASLCVERNVDPGWVYGVAVVLLRACGIAV